MFGPNYTYAPVAPANFSHRSQHAAELVARVKNKLTRVYNLDDYDLLLVPGPATLAMQIVIDSLLDEAVVLTTGKFSHRWASMADRAWPMKRSGPQCAIYCHLETSSSTIFEPDVDTVRRYRGVIVDAVSSFPFYKLPKFTDVFVTTSCKQLGGPPGVAIIGVHKREWRLFGESGSLRYTDIFNHAGAHSFTTFPVNVLEVMDGGINYTQPINLHRTIEFACQALREVIPAEMFIGNQEICPVLTVKRYEFDAMFPGVASRYQLYPETSPDYGYYHIFTYSENIPNYAELAATLKLNKRLCS
jgi:aspartate aminotransferase-like enzyme